MTTRYPFITPITSPDLATKIVAKDGTDNAGYVTVEDVLGVPIAVTDGDTPRSLPDRFSEIPNVEDWRGVGGDASDTTAIQAAIDAMSAADVATVLRLGQEEYSIETGITMQTRHIMLDGMGSDTNRNTGTLGSGAATKFVWNGAAGGTILDCSSPSGGDQIYYGGGVRGVYFKSGLAIAAKGLSVVSRYGGVFEDLYFEEFSTAGLFVDVLASLGTDSPNTSRCIFRRIGTRIVSETGIGIYVGGDADENVCFCRFDDLDIIHSDGVGIRLGNCDNNILSSVRVFRGAGSANCLVFEGSNTSADMTCRANQIIGYSANGPTVARGTTTYTHASTANIIYFLDVANGTPAPTVETGATLTWTTTEGVHRGSQDFTTWTPTIAPSAGAFGSAATLLQARYSIQGTTLTFHLVFQNSNNGTGSGYITATLPVAAAHHAVAFGYETAGGNQLSGKIAASSATMEIRAYAAAYPQTLDSFFTISGTYEIA